MSVLLALLLAGTPADDCTERLAALRAGLPNDGFTVEPAESPDVVRAVYSEPVGRIVIDYRCDSEGLAAAIDNQGLPTIPFKVLLVAGSRATLTSSVPERLRARIEAVAD